ncbi:MAG: alpha/beta hydrolase fold domain-containing protein, partial [Chloroflexi bacterium]|nr:alpha/beta hydrolase fold domain-containing protein [Chloroflexota bacterium]
RGQIVYSVHEYGPHMWQGDWFNLKTTYASLAKRWTTLWGYLLDANQYLRAPIFVGEFGTCHDYWSCITDTAGWKQGFWFKSFVRYLHEHPQVGWAYWSLNATGPFHAQDPNFYSLVSSDWHHYYPLVTRGLAPLLSEPDGTVNTWSSDHPAPFPPVPGCSPDRSCVAPLALPPKLYPVSVTRDVPYIQPADPFRSGDLYVPQRTGPAPRPAVVVVHGGSWDSGSKGTPETVLLAQALAQRGYVAFDINYRLVGHGGQYPGSIQDVEDAVAFLATQRQKLNIDLGKVGVVGESAGAYLALMAAYRFNVAPFAPPHYPRPSVRIAAVGSFFGPVELKASIRHAQGLPWVQKLAAYIGIPFGQKPVAYRMASPLRYAPSAVPTIFWDGAADPTTPQPQAFELYKRLKQRQIRSQLMTLPGAPSSITQLSPGARATALVQLISFFQSVFYHPTAWGG